MNDDYHCHRTDRASHWRRIAAHLAAHPGDLEIALSNIQRWLDWGRTHSAPILEWRRLILEAQNSPSHFDALIAYLAADNHDAETLKSCSPFVGLPIAEEPVPAP